MLSPITIIVAEIFIKITLWFKEVMLATLTHKWRMELTNQALCWYHNLRRRTENRKVVPPGQSENILC